MTTYLSYPAAPGFGIYLHHLHRSLIQSGKSEAEALRWVAWVMQNNATDPPILPGSKPSWDAKVGLIVTEPSGAVYPASNYFILRLHLPLTLPEPVEIVADGIKKRARQPIEPPALHRGGRPTEHPWEAAAAYVERWNEENGHKLERDPDDKPIIERAIDRMLVGFKLAGDKKPPPARSIRKWIHAHAERTALWW